MEKPATDAPRASFLDCERSMPSLIRKKNGMIVKGLTAASSGIQASENWVRRDNVAVIVASKVKRGQVTEGIRLDLAPN